MLNLLSIFFDSPVLIPNSLNVISLIENLDSTTHRSYHLTYELSSIKSLLLVLLEHYMIYTGEVSVHSSYTIDVISTTFLLITHIYSNTVAFFPHNFPVLCTSSVCEQPILRWLNFYSDPPSEELRPIKDS